MELDEDWDLEAFAFTKNEHVGSEYWLRRVRDGYVGSIFLNPTREPGINRHSSLKVNCSWHEATCTFRVSTPRRQARTWRLWIPFALNT